MSKSAEADEEKSSPRIPMSSRKASFVVLVAGILFIGILFYRVMAAFLLPLFLAALLVVIFRPIHVWIREKVGNRKHLAAGLSTAAILLAVLLPLTWIVTQAVIEGVAIVTSAQQSDSGDARKAPADEGEEASATDRLEEKLAEWRARFDLELPYVEEIQSIEEELNDLNLAVQNPAFRESAADATASVLRKIDALENKLRPGAHDPVEGCDLESSEQCERLVGKIRENVVAASELTLPRELNDFSFGLRNAQLACTAFRKHLAGDSISAFLKGIANPSPRQMREYRNKALGLIQPYLLSITRTTTTFAGSVVFWLAIMTLALFYFLLDGPSMVQTVMRLSPLDDRYEQQLVEEFDSISRAVVVATLLSALVQGLLAGIGYYFAGFESVFLLTVLTMVFALIPFVGAAAVWIPACIWAFVVNDSPWTAGLLAVYSVVVVSMADNVIKPFVLHGKSNMHPLLALLSVLGGVSALGPIGILVGPMVVAFFHALLNMLHRELEALEEGEPPAEDATVDPAG